MAIPTSSLFPDQFDSDDNLFVVHDSLRVRLAEDYNPGDTFITIDVNENNKTIASRFPDSGIITLTEQCSDSSEKAVSFYYGLRTETTFEDLEILPGFTDSIKLKTITNVTQNVMAQIHNNQASAIIAIEGFVGKKGTKDAVPLGETMEGRTNFLQDLVLYPRAWFESDKRVGVVPLTIKFTDMSFRNPTSWKWDFGDGDVSTGSYTDVSYDVPSSVSFANDLDGGSVEKTYYTPNIYNVKLTVSNAFGENSVIFPGLVNARAEPPDEAELEFIGLSSNQMLIEDGDLATGGILKSKSSTTINIQVTDTGEQSNDSIIKYTWKLQDELIHQNADTTAAYYTQGGYYDVKVRLDTEFGSYRTTIVEAAIDIIEPKNIWYYSFENEEYAATKTVDGYEFNPLGSVFKTLNRTSSPSIDRDYSFLDGEDSETRQKQEFLRNNGFSAKSGVGSGDRGVATIYWATGYDPDSAAWGSQKIKFIEYDGFSDCYSGGDCNASLSSNITRAWNWVGFNPMSGKSYIVLGNTTTVPTTGVSSTSQSLTTITLNSISAASATLTSANYTNGASELMKNTDFGNSGHFSTYRSAWHNQTGYLLRNDANGEFFRIKSFYKTTGTTGTPIQGFAKLNDIPGSVKMEGQLVALTSGVFFFNNEGIGTVYNVNTNTWSLIGSSTSTSAFKQLQDTTVLNYEDPTIPSIDGIPYNSFEQRLVATSDLDRKAYLAFDYSEKAFIKYNEVDNTFSSITARPSGESFLIGYY